MKKIEQIRNDNGTFTYLIDGKVIIKNSKKDYNFYLGEVGVMSKNEKTILSQQRYWIKNGNPKSINMDNLKIHKIIKIS